MITHFFSITLPFFVSVILVGANSRSSSALTDSTMSTKSGDTITKLIALCTVCFVVKRFLVIVPSFFTWPFSTTRFCLLMMLASVVPLGDYSCGSFGTKSLHCLQLKSASMIREFPASSALIISCSRA